MNSRHEVDIYIRAHDQASTTINAVRQAIDRLHSVGPQIKAATAAHARMTHPSVLAQTAALGGPAGRMGWGAAASARMAGIASPAVAAYAGAKAYGDFAEVERSLTRTGLKLGAGREQMAAIRNEMGIIAGKYAAPIAEVMQAFDSLAEAGFDFSEARASLDDVVKATQGLGGSGSDTVGTFDAARKSIGLAAGDAEKFFDIVAAGGASGKFEGSDLARYLPSLLPVAARQGYQGLEGAARLVGFLEVVRDYVGTSEEAATATADIFEKISSPDVIKNFAKVGIDLEERLGKARANGEDVLLVLSDIIREATKGDATQLSKLFGDRDSRRAANVLLTAVDRVKAAQDELRRNSGGTIELNVKAVTEDARARIDRLSNGWDKFVTNVGATASKVVTPALDLANDQFADRDAYESGIAKEEARGGTRSEMEDRLASIWNREKPDNAGWWNPERSRAIVDAIQAYGRGDTENPYQYFEQLLSPRAGRSGIDEQRAEQRASRSRAPQTLPGLGPMPVSREEAAAEVERQRVLSDQYRQLESARHAQLAAVAAMPPPDYVSPDVGVRAGMMGGTQQAPGPDPAAMPVAMPAGLDAILSKLSAAVMEKNKLEDPLTVSAAMDPSALAASFTSAKAQAAVFVRDMNAILAGIRAPAVDGGSGAGLRQATDAQFAPAKQ